MLQQYLDSCHNMAQFNPILHGVRLENGRIHRKISNIRRTKPENLSECRLVLQLPLANPLKPGIKLRMEM